MAKITGNSTILTNKLLINPNCISDFANWQAKLNIALAESPGFVSLEILSPLHPEQPRWLIIERFNNSEQLNCWFESEMRKKLMDELNTYLIKDCKDSIQETYTNIDSRTQSTVTEVFVTQVHPKNEKAYRKWIAKIHQVEAKFPGFRGVYMQTPIQNQSLNWITLLQFDTPENLDRWLNSSERQKALDEGGSLISSLESHRVISAYSSWFAPLNQSKNSIPLWKQTLIVLLVLFPIVMLELKYLSPLTTHLNPSLGTFIGNAISVSLISWPMMPIAIWFLAWWLAPKQENYYRATIIGTFIIFLLYCLEITLFWHLSPS